MFFLLAKQKPLSIDFSSECAREISLKDSSENSESVVQYIIFLERLPLFFINTWAEFLQACFYSSYRTGFV